MDLIYKINKSILETSFVWDSEYGRNETGINWKEEKENSKKHRLSEQNDLL